MSATDTAWKWRKSAQPAQGRRGRGASRRSRFGDSGQGGGQESRDRRLRRWRPRALQGQDHSARPSAGLRHPVPAGRVRRDAGEVLQRRAERRGAIRPLPARRSVGSPVRSGRGPRRSRRGGDRRRRQGLGQADDRHGLLAAATGAAGQRLRGRDAEADLRALYRRHPDVHLPQRRLQERRAENLGRGDRARQGGGRGRRHQISSRVRRICRATRS